MGKIYTNVEQLIGRTPLLELTNIEKEYNLAAKLYAKLEYFNPAGSAKDRVAMSMIAKAKDRGEIKEGTVIIEPTSGNTGIGLCAVAAAKGYKVIIVMPDNMSVERQLLMKAYGAELVLTPGSLGMSEAIRKAEEIKAANPGSIIAGQFVNPDNPRAHFETTGPEIYEDMDGQVDIFVAGIGTGGTITGVGEFLKSKNQAIKIVGIEPFNSAVISGESAGSHGLMGIGAGFVPEVLNTEIIDEIIKVKEEDAYKTGREVGKREGVLVGITSGAAVFAAIELAKRSENAGKNIVALLPDSGERYLSSPMYSSL